MEKNIRKEVSVMDLYTAIILGSIATIVLTVLLYVKVLPRKYNGTFKKNFFQFLHDYFHFKRLYIEEVLKFFFVLLTVACEAIGVFMLISSESYVGYYYSYSQSYFLPGLILMIAGPIALRLTYEFAMMMILLVNNVSEINSKLGGKKAEPVEAAPAVEAPAAEAPVAKAPVAEAPVAEKAEE
jgi:hypothetical protein